MKPIFISRKRHEAALRAVAAEYDANLRELGAVYDKRLDDMAATFKSQLSNLMDAKPGLENGAKTPKLDPQPDRTKG